MARCSFRIRLGRGSHLFGYGVTMAGMSVGFATIMGINTAVGSMLPFLVKSLADLFTPGGLVILAGITGCVGWRRGVRKGGIAARTPGEREVKRRGFGRALLVCRRRAF